MKSRPYLLTTAGPSAQRRRPFLNLLILFVLLLTGANTGVAAAAEFGEGEIYRVQAGETLNDDLYVFAQEIIIDGVVDGDVIAFGGVIEINGIVTGDLIAAGAGIIVNGEVLDDVRVAGSGITIAGTVGDDLIVAGGGGMPGMPIRIGNRSVDAGIHVAQGATVGGDAIVVGDQGLFTGDIAHNFFAGMNSIQFSGRVGGDAQLHANTLVIGNGAEVGGTLSYSSADDVPMPDDVADTIVVQPRQEPEVVEETASDRGSDLAGQFGWWLLRTLLVLTGLALAGWLLLSFAPALIVKPTTALDGKPAESVIFGFLAIALSFPIVAALVFLGGIFWGFLGGAAMFTLSFGLLATLWLLSPLVTGLWLGRKVVAGLNKEWGTLSAMLIGALAIVIVGRVFLLVPCAGPVAFGLIYLLSFAFALGGGLLSLTSRADKPQPALASAEPAAIESTDPGTVEEDGETVDGGTVEGEAVESEAVESEAVERETVVVETSSDEPSNDETTGSDEAAD